MRLPNKGLRHLVVTVLAFRVEEYLSAIFLKCPQPLTTDFQKHVYYIYRLELSPQTRP